MAEFTEAQIQAMQQAVMARNMAPPSPEEQLVSRAPPEQMVSPMMPSPHDLPDAPFGPPPPPSPPPPPQVSEEPPTREELERYGATPKEVEIATRAAAAGGDPSASGPPPTRGPVTEEQPGTGIEAPPGPPAQLGQGMERPGPSSGGSYVGGTPGGMAPFTEKRDVKYGKQVAPGVYEALGQSGRLQLEAGEQDHAANAALHAHERDLATAKMMANEQAMAQQQRLNEERDAMVQARLAQVETLNKKAQGSPDDIWSAPHVLGRLAGFLALTLGTVQMATGGKGGAASGIVLGMSGQFINGLVNQDIQAKLNERNQAGKAAGREINLLQLHEQQMGSRQKAIEATKLAYYDNILQQMEAYKADHAGKVNEANYLQLQSSVLKQQADARNKLGIQEQSDVTDEIVNKYRPPASAGAGASGPKNIPHQIRLSDGTTYALPTEALHKEAVKKLQMYQELQAVDNEALQVREKLSKLNPVTDREDFMTQKGILERLGQDRLNITSVAMGQGVVNASDRKAEDQHGTAITAGYGTIQSALHGVTGHFTDQERRAGDAGLRAEIKRKDLAQRKFLEASDARIVRPGYNVDPVTGELQPVAAYAGKDAAPAPALAPYGSRPRDPKVKEFPTSDSVPAGDRIPYAPVTSSRPMNLPTPSSHHKKKK